MEQNKTYIIILFVTLVSAGLIAAGLFLFSPRDAGAGDVATQQVDAFDPTVYLRRPSPDDPAAADAAAADEDEDAGDEATVDNYDGDPLAAAEDTPLVFRTQQVYGTIAGSGSDAGPADETDDGSGESTTDTADSSNERGTREAVRSESAPAPVDSSESPRSSGPSAAASTPTGAPVSASSQRDEGVKPAGENVVQGPVDVQEYWIQVFASTSRQSVEDIRDELLSRGFRGRISTVDINDALYYRLRFGPFEVKEEAQKFLDWLHNVPRYEASYISLEYHRR
jgi:cell division septation protein DedD